ncbi:MAG TPA: MFS transporter, partial [Phycisphaerae bacterium]
IVLISWVFIFAGAVGCLDILTFTKVAEPPMRQGAREPLFTRLLRPMRDAQFRRFVTYWSVWNIANSWCSWFWMVYLLEFLYAEQKLADHWWSHYIFFTAAIVQPVAYQIGQFLGYPIWGRAVDRFGRKPVFLVASSLHTITWLSWIFLSPAMLWWMFPIQIMGGIFGGGQDIASFNMMLHFNSKGGRGGAGYQAVGSVIFSTAGFLAACAGGWLSTWMGGWTWTFAPGTVYEHTFTRFVPLILIGSAVKYAADFIFLPRVEDVDSKPAGHALQFVLNNMYGTLNTLIFVPLRSGVEATGEGIKRLWG